MFRIASLRVTAFSRLPFKKPWLKATNLLLASTVAFARMNRYDIGFGLGPRINAAGRMDAARVVVELFGTRDIEEARRLALHLDTRNRERKEVQQQIVELAITELESTAAEPANSYVAVIAGEGWHRGGIGIAASKIAERINRPCVVLSIDGDVAHGSGPSIEPYHRLNGLTAFP